MAQHQWIERLIHYQYIAELLEGRRVLEVGCSAGQGAAFLAKLARNVVAVDTSSVELAESRRNFALPNLEFTPGEPDRLQLENQSFDVVLVPELQRWITRGSFMPELHRVLVPGGLVLFAVASADRDGGRGMAYQDLVEYLRQSFAEVRMLGEIPFHGTTVAEFEPEAEPEPQIDSTLVEHDEPPTHYLALCSDRKLPSLGYAILQVPVGGTRLGELEALREKFDQLVEENAEAELKLEDLRRQLADAERRVLEAGVEARHELTALRRELREKQDRSEALTRELAAARSALDECHSLQHEGERAVEDVVYELRQQLDEQRERAQNELQQARQMLEEHVASSQRRVKQLEDELQRARGGEPAGEPAEPAEPDAASEELERMRVRQLELEQELQRTQGLLDEALRKRRPDEEVTIPQAGAAVEPQRILELERRLDRELRRADVLQERLEQAQQRLDRERDRAEESTRRSYEERSRADGAQVRLEAAERSLEEARAGLDQQRQRAESAERRCDTLIGRLEQGAAELSSLHQRIAELQGQRQADLWRLDELQGRLREQEERAPRGAARGVDAEAEGLRQRVAELEEQLRGARPAEEAERRIAGLEKRAAELEVQNKQYGDVVSDLERKLMLAESRVVENSRKATNAESKIVQLEVRLKRSESEAATLSKWAEELREELKEAQGKSTARPATPEPEVAALRNDLREAQTRIADLEGRCDRFMQDAEAAKTALREREAALEEAMRSADGSLIEELHRLRRQVDELSGAREKMESLRRDLAEAERHLRDIEQSDAELQRTRRELDELRSRVRDVDAATEELEQLRLESMRHRESIEELERVRAELEAVRIELARAQDEARGTSNLPEETAWGTWTEDSWRRGDEELEEAEVEGYVGSEIAAGEAPELEEEEASWDVDERLRVRERQLEALLEGAALHREESERLQTQIAEMDALVKQLQTERTGWERELHEAGRQLAAQRETTEQLRQELARVGRDLARTQGELQRCHDERDMLAAAAPPASVTSVGELGQDRVVLREDLDREVRGRQRLQTDLGEAQRQLDDVRRQLRDRDRALDLVRSEDTAHRAELRELRRQLRDVEEQRLEGTREPRLRERLAQQLVDLAGARAQMAELEARLRGEASHLATLESQLRRLADGTDRPTEKPVT